MIITEEYNKQIAQILNVGKHKQSERGSKLHFIPIHVIFYYFTSVNFFIWFLMVNKKIRDQN